MSYKEAYATGIKHIQHALEWCREFEIPMLTMWGFSTDNAKRDSNEVGTLFKLFQKNLREVIESHNKNKDKLRIRFFGRIAIFPNIIREMIRRLEEATSGGQRKYQLNLMLGYGGREEIVDAINNIIQSGKKNIDEKTISESLYTKFPDPDLIIRTSGEQRLSGFMPWQSSYSELYFSKKLWPDFSKSDFVTALKDYAKRKRRYGK